MGSPGKAKKCSTECGKARPQRWTSCGLSDRVTLHHKESECTTEPDCLPVLPSRLLCRKECRSELQSYDGGVLPPLKCSAGVLGQPSRKPRFGGGGGLSAIRCKDKMLGRDDIAWYMQIYSSAEPPLRRRGLLLTPPCEEIWSCGCQITASLMFCS
jgi:hypothetical protein